MSSTVNVRLKVNGVDHDLEVEPRLLLVHALRDNLGLTGTHVGCDTSNCGACTVHINGDAVKSCTVLAVQADGDEITTIEGIGSEDNLHPVQEAFWDNHGLQCGYCTPGMIMASAALLAENPNPTEDEVRHALEGNLCRCTGYHNIVKSVLAAAPRKGSAHEHHRALRPDHVGQVAAAQGGPAADHRARPLHRRHLAAGHAVGVVRALARGAREDHLDRRHRPPPSATASAPCSPSADMDDLAGPLPMAWVPPGVEVNNPEHWPLAQGDRSTTSATRSRSCSATTATQVADAAEDVVVEYESLPVITDPEKALEGGPFVHDELGTNKVHEWSLSGGDLDAGFAEADVIVERRVVNHRTAGAPIEPRGVLADYRAGSLTVWSSTQVPHFLRLFLAILLGYQRGARARDRARGRRRLRLEAAGVRRGGARRVGLAQARAAGQVDRDADREHGRRPPGPRPDLVREDGRQARRHGDRLPRQDHRRLRRLQHAADAADPVAGGVRDGRLLRDPGGPDRHRRRVHQQVPDRRDPWRRPARGDAHDRGDARPDGARARDQPGRDPAQELHPEGQLPARGRDRRRLRLGRLRQDARPAARARRHGRVRARARVAARQGRLPRHRPLDLHRDLRPRAVADHRSERRRRPGRRLGVGDGPRPQHGRGDRLHRQLRPRPGPRDGVRPDRADRLGRRPGERRGDPRRHRRPGPRAATRTARGRSRSAARRSPSRRTRSPTRPRRSSPTRSRRRRRTSRSSTTSSRSRARRTRA